MLLILNGCVQRLSRMPRSWSWSWSLPAGWAHTGLHTNARRDRPGPARHAAPRRARERGAPSRRVGARTWLSTPGSHPPSPHRRWQRPLQPRDDSSAAARMAGGHNTTPTHPTSPLPQLARGGQRLPAGNRPRGPRASPGGAGLGTRAGQPRGQPARPSSSSSSSSARVPLTGAAAASAMVPRCAARPGPESPPPLPHAGPAAPSSLRRRSAARPSVPARWCDLEARAARLAATDAVRHRPAAASQRRFVGSECAASRAGLDAPQPCAARTPAAASAPPGGPRGQRALGRRRFRSLRRSLQRVAHVRSHGTPEKVQCTVV